MTFETKYLPEPSSPWLSANSNLLRFRFSLNTFETFQTSSLSKNSCSLSPLLSIKTSTAKGPQKVEDAVVWIASVLSLTPFTIVLKPMAPLAAAAEPQFYPIMQM